MKIYGRTMSLAVACLMTTLLVPMPTLGQEEATWVERSNENSQILLGILAKWAPELSSELGIPGLDEEVSRLPPNIVELILADFEGARVELTTRLDKEQHAAIRQDLEILLHATDLILDEIRLEDRYLVGYETVPEDIWRGIRILLDEQVDPSRRPAAVIRLNRYAGLEDGYTPLIDQHIAFLTSRLADPGLLRPVKEEIEGDLAKSGRFVGGLRPLFEKYDLEGWEAGLEALEAQIAGWDEFLRTEVLPQSRTDFRLPPDLYAFKLRDRGVDMPVEELVSRAKVAFVEIQNEMQVLARLIAEDRGLDSSDYRDVIRELKKEQVSGEEAIALFRLRIEEIEEIVRQHDLVALPERDLIIRLASEAESAAGSAPHMNPPRMLGNTSERGEFVVPLKNISAGGDLISDDFTFDAASWTLTVHEGRPGHEMQFAGMVENGVSIARLLFALNSTNAEGWALYTEAVMKPYMPLEGQLISLQHRLLRAARAFLDPGLQSGEVTIEEAMRILREEVVFSEAMALQEVERYTFESPGQATSYFCGYSRLLELRADVERIQAGDFNARAFHDFILAQGVLPPALIRKAVMEEFVGN
ncbi:MAG: DUF885 family protein [Nitrospirae bacterium]|nr:DUF885 family protein [Nitrospirota bacterium]